MSTKPVIFSGEMVRAILDDRKTQTRRVCKPYLQTVLSNDPRAVEKMTAGAHSPYGVAGDRLWVRETWSYVTKAENETFDRRRPDGCPVAMLYRADTRDEPMPFRWSPAIHMPRWASRLTLEITGIRVERLHDVSDVDILVEGIRWQPDNSVPINFFEQQLFREAFRVLWNRINANRGFGWDANPWVWVLSFKRAAA